MGGEASEGASMKNTHNSCFGQNICVDSHRNLLVLGLALLVTVSFTARVIAQEADQNGLSNIEIEYTYPELGTVVLRIGDGELGYAWTSGPSAGNEASNRAYRSRKIGNELYLVNWHDPEKEDFVVLVIDLGASMVHGTAFWAYQTNSPGTFFGKAVISRMERFER
jgi:hypothetical protein